MAAYARLDGLLYGAASAEFQVICARYELAGRFYHDLRHLDGVVATIWESQQSTNYGERYHDVAILAALYHDAEYAPGDHLNDERSAGLARTQLTNLGLASDFCDMVARAIRLTADYADVRIESPSKVQSLLAAADLKPLSHDYEVFKRDCDAVLQEYGIHPGPGNKGEWKAGMVKRLEILTKICDLNPELVDVLAVRTNIARLALELHKP